MNDFLLDNDNDLRIEGGDFIAGRSNEQHQKLLLISSKGDWKENPEVSVGAAEFLKDESTSSLLGEIKQEFEKDGLKVKSITIDDGKIIPDADY